MIREEKKLELQERMKKLGIEEKDLIEKFILSSGKGGQKVNKSSSCVYLKHEPSGIEIKCGQSRSQDSNRFFARRALCERLEEIQLKEKSKKIQLIEKIRRQKQKRSKRAKEKMLKNKAIVSEKKALRAQPKEDFRE